MSAMNAEFFDAIEQIEKEKGIPRGYMQEKIQQALLTAFKRDNPDCEDNVEVIMDENKKTISMFVLKTIVEESEYVNDATQILLDEAHHYDKKAGIGDTVRIPVETKKFGRIAAQAAKQVIIQGIREAERGIIYDEFTSKEHEILTGVVTRIDPRTGAVSIKISSNSEFTEAMLSATERIKGEELTEGDRIKVYVVEVRKSTRGPQVLISRTHPGLVKRLFELEVPEIFDGTVEITLHRPRSRQPHEDGRLGGGSGHRPDRRVRRPEGRPCRERRQRARRREDRHRQVQRGCRRNSSRLGARAVRGAGS